MLSDERKMNQINPFVTDEPGAWSAPYPYAPAAPVPDKEAMWAPVEISPMCLSDISAGGICENPPANCPISRALEPTREIEPDYVEAGSLDSLYGTKLVPKETVPTLVPRYCVGHDCTSKKTGGRSWILFIVIALLLLLLFVIARR
jgi:hypothetical protein